MKKMAWVANHAPGKEQIEMAKEMGYEVVLAPDWVLGKIGQVPPEASEEDVAKIAVEVANWANSVPASAALVQGESGLVYSLVSLLMSMGIKCYHATTRREAVERQRPDGSVEKTSVFRHVRYREYVAVVESGDNDYNEEF